MRKCWTVAPQRLDRELFGAQRPVVLSALRQFWTGTERGVLWGTERDNVFVTWAELQSPYACPKVTVGGVVLAPQAYDATLVFRRLDGQLTGRPVRASDTLAAYPLLCDRHWLGGSGETEADGRPAGQQIAARYWAVIGRLASEPLTVSASADGITVTTPTGARGVIVEYGGYCVERVSG